MTAHYEISIGYTFYDWTIKEFAYKDSRNRSWYICECKCGNTSKKRTDQIKSPIAKRCRTCAGKVRKESGKLLSSFPEMIGKKFVRWTVLKRVFRKRIPEFLCECSCGDQYIVAGSELRYGKSKMCKICSCKKRATKHNCATRHKIVPEYNSWAQMKSRCFNPNDKRYKDYGGRGIKVCKEWEESFEAFFKYIGIKPQRNMSLDRINNDGNYEPGNIRWATPKEQANNRRNNRLNNGRKI